MYKYHIDCYLGLADSADFFILGVGYLFIPHMQHTCIRCVACITLHPPEPPPLPPPPPTPLDKGYNSLHNRKSERVF